MKRRHTTVVIKTPQGEVRASVFHRGPLTAKDREALEEAAIALYNHTQQRIVVVDPAIRIADDLA